MSLVARIKAGLSNPPAAMTALMIFGVVWTAGTALFFGGVWLSDHHVSAIFMMGGAGVMALVLLLVAAFVRGGAA